MSALISNDFARAIRHRMAAVEWARDRFLIAMRDRQLTVLVLGLLVFVVYLSASPVQENRWDFSSRFSQVGTMLKGGGNLGDFAQDVIGFRRLWEHRDPYPILGPAFLEIGINWNVPHASTHPPSAFLLAAPIAYLGRALAGSAWAIFGFCLLFVSLCAYGMSWKPALGLALSSAAIWGPVAASFQQITFVWLAGVALAYHLRSRSSLWAGIGLGIASLTKFLPLFVLGYFVFQRKFRSAIGAVMVWAVTISGLLVMYPPAFTRYFEANRSEGFWEIILRNDNISIFTQAYHFLGVLGIVAVLLYVLLLVVLNRQSLFSPRRTPEYSFFLYSFLSVFLLPICWGYSLVPLLPVIGYFFAKGRGVHVLVASGVFLQLAFLPPFGSALAHTEPLLVVSTLFFMSPPEPLETCVKAVRIVGYE